MTEEEKMLKVLDNAGTLLQQINRMLLAGNVTRAQKNLKIFINFWNNFAEEMKKTINNG